VLDALHVLTRAFGFREVHRLSLFRGFWRY